MQIDCRTVFPTNVPKSDKHRRRQIRPRIHCRPQGVWGCIAHLCGELRNRNPKFVVDKFSQPIGYFAALGGVEFVSGHDIIMSMNNNIRQWHLSSDGLKRCQVATPHEVVKLMWGLVKDRRENIESVVDLGAGDSRFASVGAYQSYTGVELDDNVESVCLRPNAEVVREDAFAWNGCDFDLAIGNPPYVKASFMAPMWRQKAQRALSKGGIDLAGNANLFLYFMALALLKTNSNGLVVQLVPYEWVARPSAGGLRSFINDHGWRVEVFRFDSSIFERVLTTACITIIDKGLTHRGGWLYNRIDPQMRVRKLRAPSVEARRVTKYSKRDQLPGVYCQRGLSPGGQDIFVLTEEERVLHSLRRNLDVVPCITSLRDWPVEQTTLNADTFEKNLVLQSRRCWLIKSTTDHPSERVLRYLGNLP